MYAPIVAAVITGVCAIVGPIITFLVTRAYTGPGGDTLDKARQKALNGKWQGTFHQEVGPDGKPVSGDYSLQLTASSRVVRGEGSTHLQLGGKNLEAKFRIVGGLLYTRVFRFAYDNVDETAIHLGSMMLELSDDGRSLRGRFIAYGMVSQRLVYGTIEFKKQA